MTLQDVADRLRQQAKTAARITLNNTVLDRNDINELIARYLWRSEGNLILVASPSAIPESLSGTSFSVDVHLPERASDSFLNLCNRDATITFTCSGNTIEFTLVVDLTLVKKKPVSWQFGNSFPQLQGDYFDELTLSSPQLIFSTQPKQLNFSSEFTLSQPFDSIAQLLKATDNKASLSKLEGLIQGSKLQPEIALKASLGVNMVHISTIITIKSPEVGIKVSYDNTLEGIASLVTVPYLTASVDLTNSKGQSMPLKITGALSSSSQFPIISLYVSPEAQFSTNIDKIASLVVDSSWDTVLSSGNAVALKDYLSLFGLKQYNLEFSAQEDLSILSSYLCIGT
ncbi:MAG: hypothetical protein AAFP93_02825, partial [Bacteroidota bacterium]